MKLFLLGALTTGALLAPAPAHAQDAAGRVDSIFSFVTPGAPGCAVGVSQRGEVLVDRAYGLANVERGVPLSTSTKFDIGSVQKQFVAAAVLLLVEDGRLALTDDIRTYVPELPDYGHTITINHLLTHTSGLRDWPGLLAMAGDSVDVLTLIVRQRGLNFRPGTEMSYSNSGYVLLKEIVARRSGMTFADFARQRLFEPLGMTSSAYVADVLQGSGEIALAYRKDGTTWSPFMRLGEARGGGAIISNARDLLTWNAALTNGRLGAFVTAGLQEPAALANGRKLSYARGLMVDAAVPGGPMISHSGGAAGYSAWLGRFTGHDLSVAVLCNFEPVSATALAESVADLFLPPVDSSAPRPGPVAAEGVDVAGRVGLYLAEGTGDPMRLVVNGGRLRIAAGPPLVPVTAERFRPPRPSLMFRSQDDFALTFLSADEFELKSMEGKTTRYRRAQPSAPPLAELQALDGRYLSPDVGQAFEIIARDSGLVFRFEQVPERSLDLEAVAPDTYMRDGGLAVLRVRRNPDGDVIGVSYSTPALRDLELTRVGERAERAAAPAGRDAATPAPASDTAAAAPPLEQLVGEYELTVGRSVVITLENGQLHGEPTGNPKRALVHVSGTTFDVAGADPAVTVTFTLDSGGRASALVMRRNGNERTLTRVR